jgi:hypothetical protein
MAANGMMMDEWRVEKGLAERSRDVIKVLSSVFLERQGKTSQGVAGVPAEIRMDQLPITSQVLPLDQPVRF